MRKKIVFILAVCAVILSLTACGETASESSAVQSEPESSLDESTIMAIRLRENDTLSDCYDISNYMMDYCSRFKSTYGKTYVGDASEKVDMDDGNGEVDFETYLHSQLRGYSSDCDSGELHYAEVTIEDGFAVAVNNYRTYKDDPQEVCYMAAWTSDNGSRGVSEVRFRPESCGLKITFNDAPSLDS